MHATLSLSLSAIATLIIPQLSLRLWTFLVQQRFTLETEFPSFASLDPAFQVLNELNPFLNNVNQCFELILLQILFL